MERYFGRNCPVCNAEIKEEEAATACPVCGTAHHQACWERNGGCAAEGCAQRQPQPESDVVQPVQTVEQTVQTEQAAQHACRSCGEVLQANQKFCTKCGAEQAQNSANEQASKPGVCPSCGAQLLEGKPFCPKCGKKAEAASAQPIPAQSYTQGNNAMPYTYAGTGVVQTRQKSKVLQIVLPVIAVVMVVIIGLVGFFVYTGVQVQKRLDAIDTYRNTASDLCSEMITSGTKLEDIGNKMQTYWYNHIWKDGSFYDEGEHITTTDVTDAVMQAQTKMRTELIYVETEYHTIQTLYAELETLPVTDDDALVNIYDAVMDAYDAYVDLYECVTDPSGNYKTWTSSFGSYDTDLSTALKSLRNRLDAYTVE